ncbi:carbohydrate ABC transporter substrate-binding protein [Streptacidiphilus pinicola]|uniref:Carbohydrate ABC transporter substrate-binding protein n=1 Tax=Streptacidiphilus pinicola TaxID=2219663 RepID=A0A2X0IT48_9ACTN|nr:extracellular solute-binding protein [Streptacidiphilus pinicola]RAG86451.1 carbohydrate ABC transporter substrate-binding protein [Streptacidiphilus pinicola]
MKKTLRVAVGLAIAFSVAACSNPSAAPVTTSGAAPSNPTASLKGVTLTFLTAQNSVGEPKQVIAAFEKATGATINTVVVPDPYESNVPTKLASGEKPDLAFWQPTQSTLPMVNPAQNLLPLDNEPWVKLLGPTEQSLGQVDGHRYAAVVTSPAVLGVYYNKADFAKAGITTMPSSYDQLIADAKQIRAKDSGVAPFFEVGGDKWPLQWQVQVQMTDLPDSFWQNVNANKASWTDPRIVAAITKYKTEILDGGLAQSTYKTGTFVDQGQALMKGDAAMALNVTSLQSEIQASNTTQQMDNALGWFPIANSAAQAEYSPDQTNGVVAFNTGDATREAAARQFIDFWLTTDYKDYIAAQKLVSVEPSVPNPDGLPQTALAQAAALSKATGVFQVKALTAPDMHLALADMIYGSKTPQQVAQAAEDQFVQVLKARGVSGF